jgi:hypothetical protein
MAPRNTRITRNEDLSFFIFVYFVYSVVKNTRTRAALLPAEPCLSRYRHTANDP